MAVIVWLFVKGAGNSGNEKYYANHLPDNARKAYSKIASRIDSMPENIKINNISHEELQELVLALVYDNPELFFLGDKSSTLGVGLTFFHNEYTMTKQQVEQARKEIDAVTDKIFSTLTDPNDKWLTEKELHDYLINNCTYTTSEEEHASDIYGALVKGKACCQGYSLAMKYLCAKAGIDCWVVSGYGVDREGNADAHMWNIVDINGTYCQLDVTWDDDNDDKGRIYYTYFNVTDSEINRRHSDWDFDYDCLSDKYSYFNIEGLLFGGFDSTVSDRAAVKLIENARKGNNSVALKFSSFSDYASALRRVSDGDGASEIIKKANKAGLDYNESSCSYIKDDDIFVLTILPKS